MEKILHRDLQNFGQTQQRLVIQIRKTRFDFRDTLNLPSVLGKKRKIYSPAIERRS